MKVELYQMRDLNHDTLSYDLSLDYPVTEINKQESILYKNFRVYYQLDNRVYKFVVVGKYFNNDKIEDFELCVEEFKDYEYNSDLLKKIFFNSRNTINSLIQAYFGGAVKVNQDILNNEVLQVINTEDEQKFLEQEYSDTFVYEDVKPKILVEEDKKEVFEEKEPVIILDKKKAGRPAGNKKKVPKEIKV